MRRIGDLFKELGFNKDSSPEVQKAFVRHLIKAAAESRPVAPPTPIASSEPKKEAQLSFDAEILGTHPLAPGRRKTKTR
ncbi:MAG TPA: hypothetical protein PKC28_01110 [Bdellovibrionales bacterium]|nr:hypothetical protein [Bdellovibrionales bacterium]